MQQPRSKEVSTSVAKLSRLRAWRTGQKLTLQEVADLTGYSMGMLSRVERGLIRPSRNAKVKIARSLGVRISELFGEAE